MMLFFIAVAGPVKGSENQLFNILKKSYGNEIAEKDIVENLYSLELVDWFKNEITKISDQSFGNYIMYYVLFEKKNQTETAQYFNVTQSNIQQILSKTHFYVYKDAFDSVNKILSEVKGDNDL